MRNFPQDFILNRHPVALWWPPTCYFNQVHPMSQPESSLDVTAWKRSSSSC